MANASVSTLFIKNLIIEKLYEFSLKLTVFHVKPKLHTTLNGVRIITIFINLIPPQTHLSFILKMYFENSREGRYFHKNSLTPRMQSNIFARQSNYLFFFFATRHNTNWSYSPASSFIIERLHLHLFIPLNMRYNKMIFSFWCRKTKNHSIWGQNRAFILLLCLDFWHYLVSPRRRKPISQKKTNL